MKTIVTILQVAATAAAGAVSVGVYGGAAVPVGGLASADYGHFNWLIQDNPGSEHDLVDPRGITLAGTGAGATPAAGIRAAVGVASRWEAEVAALHLYTRAGTSAPKSAIENPETRITAATAGVNFVEKLGPFRATAGAGGGLYFTAVSLFASGEGRSGFVYSKVHTLEKSVRTDNWGAYAGGGLAYPLGGGLSLAAAARYHWIANGGTYEITIYERYGYDPYHYTEYVFGTPLFKTYDDQFVELALGLAYEFP
ncbi:MAG: hypothetical protein JSU81_07235 [Candidatus Coatesbacteria bacterium]|nr:MAG: hypothetical protein JSU81_07235 [Candidatus Coatesbacteria bacterium]